MKTLLILLTLISFSNRAYSSENPFGLGVIINNPTGFSGKYRLSKNNSIDGALGYSFGQSDVISIHSTYLWETNQGFKVDRIFIGYYFGLGAAFYSRDKNERPPSWARDNTNDELGLAVRGLAGLNYYFNNPRIEVFSEIALNFFFVPSTDIDLGLALGGRYYF